MKEIFAKSLHNLIDMLARNRQLKSEMAELDEKCSNAIGERDQLQMILEGFGNCSDAYEEALKRITELEIELHDAKNEINTMLQTNKMMDQVLTLDELLINKESLTRHHKCVSYNLEKKSEPT
ncbi:unnamed protein product, partial [Leptidea sinapis]